jgi:hypothetical protein
MLNRDADPVAWTQFMYELEDAHEHLGNLIALLTSGQQIDDTHFAVDLGHVYAHLNRAWHSKNETNQISDENWPKYTEFPTDVRPVG